MAIVVIVKSLKGLKCGKKGIDRFVKIDFRGVSHYSSSLEGKEIADADDSVINVNQSFTWNFGRAVQESETLQLSVVAKSVLRNEKIIGRYGIVLQSVVKDGRASITDALVDLNNKPIAVIISFEIRYEAPDYDGGSDTWSSSYATTADMFQQNSLDERQMLIDIEENIANLEKSLANREAKMKSGQDGNSGNTSHDDKPTSSRFKNLVHQYQRSRSNPTGLTDSSTSRRKTSPFKTVKSMMRLGKQRPPRQISDGGESSDCSESRRLIDSCRSTNISRRASNCSLESNLSSDRAEGDDDSCGSSLLGGAEEDDAWNERGAGTNADINKKSIDGKNDGKTKNPESHSASVRSGINTRSEFSLKAQHYQVCITIIEARQLAGLNMDPVVCVQIGDQRKYTSVKESTNCPYYNEYFVFDFHMPPVMLLDKIIILSVQQSRNILRANLTLGSFKLDIATVWAQQDHQFYHKWALLTDSEDPAGGPKGYLKCDISVIGKGDSLKIPTSAATSRGVERDDDDIEGNLLLPAGAGANVVERQRARFIVKIFRADGLPKMNSSVMASVKKAFAGGQVKDLVDPYVRVSFAGLSGKTSVKRNSYAPVWNEQVVFTEMFPPLCQRIKIQLRDDDPVNGSVIGTHFIDLKEISNDGERGFLPTFGPAFLHLYGSTRDYSLVDRNSTLNTGLGEGISYRARLLVAIRTEMCDNADVQTSSGSAGASEVSVCQTTPANENAYATNEEFFLFATIIDATMIDKKLGERPMYFEISIGNAGNTLDGHNESSKVRNAGVELQMTTVSKVSPHEPPPMQGIDESWKSTTFSAKPMTHDRLYYFMPYWDDKPCLYVRSVWPDYRRRMYNSNVIGKIVEKLEEGLTEVQLHENDPTRREKILKAVLDDLCAGCNRYASLSKPGTTGSGAGLGKTKLDKERTKLCQRELENIGSIAKNLKTVTTKNSFKGSVRTARTFLEKLKFLQEDPQQSLPDIFIWVISSGKRIAYHRIPARDVIYSIVDEESGRCCGTVQNVYLKLPGKKGFGTSGWTVQAKLQMYMWLGISRHKKYLMQGLPKGYEMNNELKNLLERPRAPPPSTIHYIEKHLRAHMYQARSLIGSDSSGLSDPFARVICGEYHKTTQVIDETLSPTWDELLIIDNIIIYTTGSVIKKEPPTVVIELFDRDKVGKAEYIGRTIARARVKLASDVYGPPEFPPSLEWHKVTRGTEAAGELLAVFELLEYEESSAPEPRLPEPKWYKQTADAQSELTISEIIDQGPIFPVPSGIRPTLSKYRIEVLFWGLRDLRRIHLLSVDKPRVDIECAGNVLHSSVIQNARKNPNFSTLIKFMDLELPDQELYRPPVTIRTIDCRSFGRYTLVGTHTISSIQKYMHLGHPHLDKQSERRSTLESAGTVTLISLGLMPPSSFSGVPNTRTNNKKDKMRSNVQRKKSSSGTDSLSYSLVENSTHEDDSSDWWTKYFASIETMMAENEEFEVDEIPQTVVATTKMSNRLFNHPRNASSSNKKNNPNAIASGNHPPVEEKKIATMKIYRNELESQSEFQQFREWLDTFELYRGKNSGALEQDAASRVVGSFKGALRVYKQQRWPSGALSDTGSDEAQIGYFQNLPIPSNEPIRVLVRVYIVRANDLHPCDPNGKADPYVVLQLGDKIISDKSNYSSKQLNLVLGKCFEIEATLPQDALLVVKIVDWDLVGPDDVIGETKIDLENRYYSKHRATCGLARQYDESGYNKWRDPMKPTQILSKLCKDSKLDPPSYSRGRVSIGRQIFTLSNEEMQYYDDVTGRGIEERLALAVLNRWVPSLVPEHVESRPLYNPEKPGIEQGRLDMWVDMFPMDMPLPGPPIDISPRKPEAYELRIIIWNTEDVVLEDDAFFTGEKMSDIYVKGWLKGSEDCQSTDIHYRSLTGEGNFNWRFIYPFDYLVAEERIVIRRKESLFSWDETEFKIPARLELQVWDADHFSADDFLGAITLNLNRFPRGAKTSKLCTLNMLKTDGSVPVVNIFKQKRVRGWWPFYVKKQNEDMELTGKVEAEIHLLTKEEAESKPAGLGRSEPDPLDKPSRPDASFVWLLNPIKSIRYIIWHNYKWIILKILITIAIATLLILFLYAIPGYSVKKILGA